MCKAYKMSIRGLCLEVRRVSLTIRIVFVEVCLKASVPLEVITLFTK